MEQAMTVQTQAPQQQHPEHIAQKAYAQRIEQEAGDPVHKGVGPLQTPDIGKDQKRRQPQKLHNNGAYYSRFLFHSGKPLSLSFPGRPRESHRICHIL